MQTSTLTRVIAVSLASLALASCSMFGGHKESAKPAATSARATLRTASGATVGDATLQQTAGGVLITGDFSGLPAGTHGIHLHAVGSCSPDFAAAGPHFNPTARQHGLRNPMGKHAGDLPNISVPEGGVLRVELLATDVTLSGKNGLLDGDGASIVIHALADDYVTDPAGGSGARIACGVIGR